MTSVPGQFRLSARLSHPSQLLMFHNLLPSTDSRACKFIQAMLFSCFEDIITMSFFFKKKKIIQFYECIMTGESRTKPSVENSGSIVVQY